MADKHILKLFKSVVVTSRGPLDLSNLKSGFITNFKPTPRELRLLWEEFKPLDIKTLFTVEERETASLEDLLYKQILHYIEVYGLGAPGLFNLEQVNGQVITIVYVQGITEEELGQKVRDLLYKNAPIKDTIALKEIIDTYRINFDLRLVKNNEMRVLLFKLGTNTFDSGDDAVRYMCWVATESALLIKSKQVIQALEAKGNLFPTDFFKDHERPLAKVFHRHKNLILAAKTKDNCGAINKIGRLAKSLHEPIFEPLSKRFIMESYWGRTKPDALDSMSTRDKFKFLNLLRYKSLGNSMDAFIIRNGKVHLEKDRKVLDNTKLQEITLSVLDSLKSNLKSLKGVSILLDPNVDYGLPISRKQAIGQLPFGTTITPNGNTISSGIYWEDKGGARDLDLSAIYMSGSRVGWGQYSGYTRDDIVFSGDVTSAHQGAMEFMTSKVDLKTTYALFVNIFNGEVGSKFALVVGTKSDKWIETPVLRELGELHSKGNIIGFVKNGKFVVFSCRLNNSSWSKGSKEVAIVNRGLTDFWTIRALFDALGVSYTLTKELGKTYNHDLSYQGFSLDKLETMFQPA